MKRRIPALVAALGLFAMLIPLTTSSVLAWSPPNIASVCSNDQTVNNWTVTLSGPSSDFGPNDIQWAGDAAFTSPTTVTMVAGANPLSTPSSVTTLYIRWSADHGSKANATWTGGPCSSPPPSDSPFQSFQGETATVPADPSSAPPQVVQLTLIKVLCPTYTVVPANKNPTNYDATGGHGALLDTSYQTTLVDPSTDIPKACARADGWQFQLYSADSGPTVGSPLTTGADGVGTGSVTIVLDSTELALAQTTGAPTGLWVSEIMQPSVATFGALRCYTDIQNGDNVENIRQVGTADSHIYCIAYNVVVARATQSAVQSATAVASTCATAIIVDAAVTPSPCVSPFQSFQGETATAGHTTTPPPTSTGSGVTTNSSTPLLALLICFAFGALGLGAVEVQRRSVHR